jgi:anti-sigma B factor antagonist
MPVILNAVEEVTVLTLTDEVLNEACLRAAVRLLDKPGAHALHLDLAAIRLPTAEGLGLLVTLNQELRARGGHLAMCRVRPDVYEVFVVTGLTGVLDVRAAGGVAPHATGE